MKLWFAPVALALSMSLSGCAAVVLGSAGVAAYEVQKDERSAGTVLDDASITATIKTRLLKDKGVNGLDINVDTFDGGVTLYGYVDSLKVRERVTALAWSVKGVDKVISKLVVIPPAE
ncbi:BON domain-containing protein [Pelagibaculum spongiae]|uniref:BON domain-containing protein n=1 Tax=Pelagibaculum spongiae TaxID=2080658 RepID=A0A2V1GW30_9GAMM|nr:BON domain-containing protein [Pelagibaculum spongiae]PVZ70538.1 hypothetical protein DC094_08125 [Pelagibaculum spongiae]